jgi:hypothetical protein
MFSMGTLKTSEAAALLHAGPHAHERRPPGRVHEIAAVSVRDGAGAHERREAQA